MTTGTPVVSGLERAAGRERLRDAFARDVRDGLTAQPKRLACRWFYDDEGSRLFETICELPEYYLTRAEQELLAEHAGAIAARLPRDATLVELGSGNAAKTRLLIEALLARQRRLRYVPIDIAHDALDATARALAASYAGLDVRPLAADWEEALAALGTSGPLAVLWLGSSIGNLTRPEAARFLARVAELVAPRGRMLCGIDLRKDRRTLEAAYDDASGVTARFNLNLLVRINRELGADFALDGFLHRAVYEEDRGRVAMYVVSRRAQRVRIPAVGLDVVFDAGEAVHTEDSWKYSVPEIDALAAQAGFDVEARWLDRAGRFSETLLVPRR
ncbi:MAG: L-histidine N(alpha)-methyltransferase [Candidatus Rokubacteria bacterium]|nr:L-histidine N(alpha)-methyltransferase [Candidatus Rokubacteria bacterium]